MQGTFRVAKLEWTFGRNRNDRIKILLKEASLIHLFVQFCFVYSDPLSKWIPTAAAAAAQESQVRGG